ncbi:hypothetical protein Ddye_028543 [Dipteronia dyeriana]|uniref:Uncharacterized protein n=1 Tax=Dipteronia dyeriana TaxID=168575 RepID=A0AAD9WJS2_9ROSI|nr:hypothetical protein Ddye_028543 [Dipteronia dyeriana]
MEDKYHQIIRKRKPTTENLVMVEKNDDLISRNLESLQITECNFKSLSIEAAFQIFTSLTILDCLELNDVHSFSLNLKRFFVRGNFVKFWFYSSKTSLEIAKIDFRKGPGCLGVEVDRKLHGRSQDRFFAFILAHLPFFGKAIHSTENRGNNNIKWEVLEEFGKGISVGGRGSCFNGNLKKFCFHGKLIKIWYFDSIYSLEIANVDYIKGPTCLRWIPLVTIVQHKGVLGSSQMTFSFLPNVCFLNKLRLIDLDIFIKQCDEIALADLLCEVVPRELVFILQSKWQH